MLRAQVFDALRTSSGPLLEGQIVNLWRLKTNSKSQFLDGQRRFSRSMMGQLGLCERSRVTWKYLSSAIKCKEMPTEAFLWHTNPHRIPRNQLSLYQIQFTCSEWVSDWFGWDRWMLELSSRKTTVARLLREHHGQARLWTDSAWYNVPFRPTTQQIVVVSWNCINNQRMITLNPCTLKMLKMKGQHHILASHC